MMNAHCAAHNNRTASKNELQQKIEQYWTVRAPAFGEDKRRELATTQKEKWRQEFIHQLPACQHLSILDVGTGAGFFAFILQEMGHFVTGIDITQAMLDEAKKSAALSQYRLLEFVRMDAQRLIFPTHSFDVVISRNVTWTLPDPEAAYREWARVLKPGGLLLNFDAEYDNQLRPSRHAKANGQDEVHHNAFVHNNLTEAQHQANREITFAAPCADKNRPYWDAEFLRGIGFAEVALDVDAGKRVLGEFDAPDAPLFLIRARKA